MGAAAIAVGKVGIGQKPPSVAGAPGTRYGVGN
jgi:hypothetical protein